MPNKEPVGLGRLGDVSSLVASRFDFGNYHTTDLIRGLFILAILSHYGMSYRRH